MIITRQLTLKAGARTLVDGPRLAGAPRRECWSVIGRNGAGKSTLMRTLAGLRAPDGGSIAMQGRRWATGRWKSWRASAPSWPSRAVMPLPTAHIETVLAARHPYHAKQLLGRQRRPCRRNCAALEPWKWATWPPRRAHAVRRRAPARGDCRAAGAGHAAAAARRAGQRARPGTPGQRHAPAGKLCREQGKTVVMIGHDLNLAHQAFQPRAAADGRWRAGWPALWTR
jgi:iron complex transport system ATP-binding protein